MNISLGVLFGLIAMIGWGTADFFVANSVRKTSVFKTFVWSQIFGIILFLLIFLLFFKFPTLPFASIGVILIAGFLGVISYLAYYKGLQVGNVSIISPVAACWAAVTVILSLIFLHEKPTVIEAAGVSLAILGTVLVSFRLHDLLNLKLKNIPTGIEYAIIAMFAWGVYFVLIGALVGELGWFLPIFSIKATSILYLLLYSGITRKDISFPKNVTKFIVLIGTLETLAFLFYGLGVTSEYTAIVAPISATFPMVTILLAKIFFKETLDINQKIGIVSILVGLVLLST